MEKELEKAKKNADNAKSQWESLRKEREFHKENYLKTKEAKEIISRDIKTLKKIHENFVSKIDDLKKKYEDLCKTSSLNEMMIDKYTKMNKDLDIKTKKIEEEIKRVKFII
jgi:hypothetical protein